VTAQPEEENGAGIGELMRLLADAPAGDKLVHGTFSVYKTEEGGLHVAYRLDGSSEDGHLPIPAGIIKLASAAASGRGPLGMLARTVL
jgi:hypothetical protein